MTNERRQATEGDHDHDHCGSDHRGGSGVVGAGVTPQAREIVLVHFARLPCDMDGFVVPIGFLSTMATPRPGIVPAPDPDASAIPAPKLGPFDCWLSDRHSDNRVASTRLRVGDVFGSMMSDAVTVGTCTRVPRRELVHATRLESRRDPAYGAVSRATVRLRD